MSLDAFVVRTKKRNDSEITQECLLSALKDKFHHDSFRSPQLEIVKSICIDKKDTFVLLPTGAGKSLCYQLPGTVLTGITIVISPLLALINEQVTSLKKKGINVASLDSTQKGSTVDAIYKDLMFGTPTIKILYTTPETLSSNKLNNVLKVCYERGNLSLFAIDEAHCISSWGMNFRPSYRRLGQIKKNYGKVPVIALTATATPKVRDDIIKSLNLKDHATFISSFNRPEITYQVKRQVSDVDEDLVKFLKDHDDECGIIYCRSKKGIDSLVEKLNENGFPARAFHGDIPKKEKAKIQEQWGTEFKLVVGSIALGMGIDKSDVRFVVHMTVPDSLESFYQQSGRCGRDGKPSISLLYFSYDEQSLQEYLITTHEKDDSHDEAIIKNQLEGFQKFVKFCTGTECRRKYLLQYFGEITKGDICKKTCDFCINPFGNNTSEVQSLTPWYKRQEPSAIKLEVNGIKIHQISKDPKSEMRSVTKSPDALKPTSGSFSSGQGIFDVLHQEPQKRKTQFDIASELLKKKKL